MKYAVRVEYIGHAWVEVEAGSSEEAHDKALEIGVNSHQSASLSSLSKTSAVAMYCPGPIVSNNPSLSMS